MDKVTPKLRISIMQVKRMVENWILQITLYFCDNEFPLLFRSRRPRLIFWFIYDLQIHGGCATVSEHACLGRGNTLIAREKKCTKLEFITHCECIRLDIVFCFSPSIRLNLSHLSLSAHKIFLCLFHVYKKTIKELFEIRNEDRFICQINIYLYIHMSTTQPS